MASRLAATAGRVRQRRQQERAIEATAQAAQVQRDQAEQLRIRQQNEEAARLKPTLEQFGGDVAQQLGGLLTSGSPEARGLGAQQLGGLLGQQQTEEFRLAQLGPVQQEQIAASQLQTAAAANQALRASLDGYRDDLRADIGGMSVVAVAGADVVSLLATGTALGATAAVQKLARTIDTLSAAREGEVRTLQQGLGAGENLLLTFAKLGGEGMGPEGIKDFIAVVDAMLGNVALDTLGRITGYRSEMTANLLPEEQQNALFQQAGVTEDSILKLIGRALPYMSADQRARVEQLEVARGR